MKIEEFDIRFDNEDAVFSAGQNVTGSVVLEISKPTHIFSEPYKTWMLLILFEMFLFVSFCSYCIPRLKCAL